MSHGKLYEMVVYNDIEGIRKMIQGRDLSEICRQSSLSTLHLAVCRGNFEITKMLLDAKVATNSRDYRGYGLLECAVTSYKYDVLKLLLQYNVKPIGRVNDCGRTVLHLIMYNITSLKYLRIILKSKDVCKWLHHTDSNDRTPLDVALFQGELKCAQLLTDAGAKPSLKMVEHVVWKNIVKQRSQCKKSSAVFLGILMNRLRFYNSATSHQGRVPTDLRKMMGQMLFEERWNEMWIKK